MRNWVRLRNVGSDRRMRVPRDGGTWPRCRRAARPGRVPRQHIEPHASTPGTTGAKGTGGSGGHGRASRRRAERSSQRGRLAGGLPPTAQHGPTGAKGAGGSGGHGRASRSTTPSRRLACGDLAGGRALRRPEHPWGHTRRRNTSGITRHVGITKPPGPTGAGRLSQYQRLIAGPRRCRGLRGRSPGERWKYQAWRQRPSRSPPCGDPRRRRWRSAWPSRQRSRRRCPRSRPG